MNLENNTKHTVGHQPVKNSQTKSLPPHAEDQQFMGADTGVNGRMGDYSRGVTNEE